MQSGNFSLHIHRQRRVLNYCCGRNQVRWRPGQEACLVLPCSNLRYFGSKCTIEESTCDIVGTFRRPTQSSGAPIVIRRPGNCTPFAPLATPLIIALSDAPQQTMAVLVLSSNQRHVGIFGFGGGDFSIRPILRHCEENQ